MYNEKIPTRARNFATQAQNFEQSKKALGYLIENIIILVYTKKNSVHM